MTTQQKIKEIFNKTLIISVENNRNDLVDVKLGGVEDCVKEISSLIPKWRKVEDGKPEEATAILIFFKYWNTFVKGSYCKDIKGNDLWISEEARTIYEPVEYWMYESEILDLIPKP
jgi:hypothetical protein